MISRNPVKKYVHQVYDVRDGKTEEIIKPIQKDKKSWIQSFSYERN